MYAETLSRSKLVDQHSIPSHGASRKSRSSSTAAAIFRRDHRAPRPARGEFAKAGNAEAEGTALCTLMTAFGTGGPPPKKSRVITATYGKKWRRRRDSNPRYPLQGTTI